LDTSEEYFAQTETFSTVTLRVEGAIDVDAISTAFDVVLQTHPVLTAHIEKVGERYEIVTDDLQHPGIWVVKDGRRTAVMHPDQSVSLLNLMVQPGSDNGDGYADVTLYIHHSLADGAHMMTLMSELFSAYTDLVCTGNVAPPSPEPVPDSLETVLQSRGIQKQLRSGLERLIPAMFGYDLPPRPDGHGDAKRPVPIPAARGRLTPSETSALVNFAGANRLFLNNVVSAAALLVEWQLRETPHVPLPFLYPVDLRMILDPPVTATGATNPTGVAAYLAQITRETNLVDLARELGSSFQTDLSEGIIQQSQLHFTLEYGVESLGLPDIVLLTNLGRVPSVRTPPGVDIVDWRTEHYRKSLAVNDVYSVGIFDDHLLIEHHVHSSDPGRSVGLILSRLRKLAQEQQ
jgi:hypothetical protein